MRSGSAQDLIDSQFIQAVTDKNQALAQTLLGNEAQCYAPSSTAKNTALVAAVRSKQVEMATWLLDLGADADQISNLDTQRSLLQYAVHYQDEKMVECLLPRIKFIDHISRDGQTALHYAIQTRNMAIFRMLLAHNASLNCRGTSHTGRVIRSQIGMILTKGYIELAREMFALRPTALSDFQKIHPNVISYIVKETNADSETCTAMIHSLITDVPAVMLSGKQALDPDLVLEAGKDLVDRHYPLALIELIRTRIELNSLFLACQTSDGGKINKQLLTGLANVALPNPALLANDLLMMLANNHPIISKERYRQIFREHLAIFISPANSKLSMRFGAMLKSACDHLLDSNMKDSNETQIICKLTLLTLLQTISHGKEDVYREIVNLMMKMLPATNSFDANGNGEALLARYIQCHHEDISRFINGLKIFYCEWLHIRLSPDQVNPCVKIEMMLQANHLQRAQAEVQASAPAREALELTYVFLREEISHLSKQRDSANASLLEAERKTTALQEELTRQQDAMIIAQTALSLYRNRVLANEALQDQADSPVKQGKKNASTTKKREERPTSNPEADPRTENMPLLKPINKRYKLFDASQIVTLPVAAPEQQKSNARVTRSSSKKKK